jgi:aconitase B
MENNELVLQLNKELAIELPEKISAEELQSKLAIHINHLIQHHFEQLVSLLYRIDVSEAKIKSLLQIEPDKNAGDLIAALIIERQVQKIKSRQQFKQPRNNFDEEEKW